MNTMTPEYLYSLNPATGEVIGQVQVTPLLRVPEIVQAAKSAQKLWSAVPLEVRCEQLLKVADIMQGQEDELAELVCREQGKPISEARGEVHNAVARVRYFAHLAKEQLQPRKVVVGEIKAIVERAPHGVVAAIKPWNFPVSTPLWTIVPALLGGNSVVFKPSELTPLVGQKMVELFHRAGLAPDLLQIVQGGEGVGKALVSCPVNMIGFVGSTSAGQSIMREAASNMKRVALELGGKDAMLVLSDADIDLAVQGAIAGAFKNCGQVCCSVERLYVAKEIFPRFIKQLVAAVQKLKVGSGLGSDIELGPMVSHGQRAQVLSLVEDALQKGAKALLLGKSIEGAGSFLSPSILTQVPKSAKIYSTEVFGPVLQVEEFESVDQAIDLANALPFGLTASVWGQNVKQAQTVARQLEAGTRTVNLPTNSMVELPWGGRKLSGIGRMLGHEGLLEFTEPVVLRTAK